MDDPRNIVLWAEQAAGYPWHYFKITFDEMKDWIKVEWHREFEIVEWEWESAIKELDYEQPPFEEY